MLVYACVLFTSTMKLGGFLAIIGAVAVLFVFGFELLGATIGEFIVSWGGMLFSIIVATVYFTIRKFFVRIRL